MLGIAFVLDGYSLITAWKAFNAKRGSQSLGLAKKSSKDAATFTVLFEDASDVLGLIIAFLGVFLGQVFDNPLFDGSASILIGILLVGVAGVLARESKSLLLGEGVDAETAQQLKALTGSGCIRPESTSHCHYLSGSRRNYPRAGRCLSKRPDNG